MSDIPGDGESGAGAVATAYDSMAVGRVQIKVNGISIAVTETVGIREMLEAARSADAIEGSIEAYVIERVETEGEIKIGETIVVKESEEFLAVPTGPTEVA